MAPVTGPLALMLLLLGLDRYTSSAAAAKNRCDKTTLVMTKTECHSCSISSNVGCPAGFNKKIPGKGNPDCKYRVSPMASLVLNIKGCSHECYKEVVEPHCCPGYWGPDCIECPEDADRPCSNNGLCSEGMGGNGSCSCKVLDDDRTSELPECSSLLCPQNTRCMQGSLDGSLRCQCLPGYRTSGDQCISINPCLQQVCHIHATCAHVGPNKHLCTCAQGYSGDGHVCVPIDPCQTHLGGCSADSARCVYDGPGKSHCECQDGFDHLTGGVSCSLKDLCRPNSCSKHANCSTVEPNIVECTCHEGYVGNGKICYGNIMQRLNDLNSEPGGQWTGQLSAITWPLSNFGPFTIFVPINKGFKGTPVTYGPMRNTAPMTGHAGHDKQLKIRIHGSRKKGGVLQSDVIASNGIIHIINKLMDSVSPTVESDKEVHKYQRQRLRHKRFIWFDSSVQKANVDSVLEEAGPSTIFAPTNTAFNAMKEGQLDYLTSSEGSTKLLELLRNHVIPSFNLEFYNAVSNQRIRTIANQILSFNVTENGQILVNGMAVLEADVEAKNGRLYSMDGVLIPPSIEPVLPHRCDITENKLLKGDCVSCSKVTKSGCPSGPILLPNPTSTSPSPQTPLCCKGFYGPDCTPCPGGFNTPCSRHGQCSEGIEGNGTCVCETNFKGSRCHYCSNPNKYGPACDKTCDCIHGVCDNRPEAEGRCKVDSCQQGYTGQYCERHTQACGPQVTFCHAHADCSDCALHCPLQAKCIKTGPVSHTCQCLAGWRMDEDGCQPINDCLGPDRGGCHPNATCIYVGPGQSGCACKSGFRGNGRECEASNPCVAQNGGCHYLASCLYVSGAWKCVCEDGYTGDGEACYGNVGQVSTSYLIAKTGISQLPLMNSQNITLLVPSTAATDKMTKEDKDFWTTQGNLPSIIKNHMIQGVYSLDDLRDASSNLQLTSAGFIRRLNEGLLELLARRPEFSLFKSYLVHHNLTAEIEQASAYTVFAPTDGAVLEYLKNTASDTMDLNTTRYHIVLSDRLMKVDLLGGTYKETMLGFSYQLGILPRDDKLFVNEAQVNVSDILGGKGVIHGLSAVLDITKNRCDIQQFKTFPALVRKKCMFSRVYQGERLLSIGCRTICKNTTIVRRCCGGFYGEHCEPCPGPKGQPCNGNGMCQDRTNGTGVCQCNKSFNGTACETCQEGKYGIHCDQDCRCKNGRCNDGIHGDGTCECDAYWRGVACDDTANCGSISSPLLHLSHRCVVGRCECLAGFQGNGTDCKAKDACKDNNGGCSPHAVCKRTLPGRRQCVCNTGYHGDGMVCVQINPCLDGKGGCHVNADCIHTGPNKTSCVCSQGYTGDGKESCTVINLCRTKQRDCHRYARCNMTGPGERSCTCMNGYVGDGISCKGTVGKVSRRGDYTYVKEGVLLCFSLQDTDVLAMVNDPLHQPVTLFLPSDRAMAALPQEQKDFLYNTQNRGHLLEYLKYHILRDTKVYATELVHIDPIRTLQGSELKANCGGLDNIGEIFLNDGNCRIIQRHLLFNGGIAYGIDCLLNPPSLGGRCDRKETVDFPVSVTISCSRFFLLLPWNKEVKKCDLHMIVNMNKGCQAICTFVLWQPKCCAGFYGRDCLVCPGGNTSPCLNHGKCDDGHLGNGNCTCDTGFHGDACELCKKGHYGPDCTACNCTEHGSCEEGLKGTGSCFCEQGWTGQRCETQLAEGPVCSPTCSQNGICKENNTCQMKLLADLCKFWNGGCAQGAKCSQKGEKVSCACPQGHSGDGFICRPIDPCSVDDNGGCHEHATCTMTGPGKKKCVCKDNYIGDGVTCEVKELLVNRCLQENGQCHSDAQCTDLHYEDSTVGVFHFRSNKGQYKLNYTSAQEACTGEGGSIATYTQLSYAQQAGLNLCAASWLDQARVAYPTTYSNPKCGFGHVGIVDYGLRNNLSETWDTFCYRVKEVKCECKAGYIGDGYSCTGNLLQVLTEKPTFSNFLSQILNYSQMSVSGKQFMKRLSNLTIQSTLFVPDNTGLYQNQVQEHPVRHTDMHYDAHPNMCIHCLTQLLTHSPVHYHQRHHAHRDLSCLNIQNNNNEIKVLVTTAEHVTTPAQDLHIRLPHLRDRLTPVTWTADETGGLHNQKISA
uniref:Stabilin 2 n=1 Tax=Oncorhynchus tshawytscha TaxID=74940 RepID=A0AAZ3NWQ7_ONCTS